MPRSFLKDRHFWIALAAGPICWSALVALGIPQPAGSVPASTLVHGVLIYPVLEEIVFRGGLQTFLLRAPSLAIRRAGLTGANLLTSIGFAALHLWSQSPLWAALIVFPSLVFGYLRDRHDSVLPSIIVHAVYNAGFLILFA